MAEKPDDRAAIAADDRAAIAAVMSAFFAAFATGPDVADRLAGLRELLVPEAVIVKACGDPTIYDVDAFIAPRAELLTGGRLTDFAEWEVDGRTDLFGDVAAHTCTYAKEGVLDGRPFTGRGFKSLHLVRLNGDWRISAVVWDDERDEPDQVPASSSTTGANASAHSNGTVR